MELKITNPDKILFPKDKITKLDLINYYVDISHLMLPFVENRLLSVIRCHEGIVGGCFFKKHPNNDSFVHVKQYKGEPYFYIKTQDELVYQTQIGTIEFHPWGSCVDKPNKPNMMIFDLDPDEKISVDKLRDAVLKVKEVLDELCLKSFLKTSGGKGYHIVVPFKETKDWDSFYDFSRQIAMIVESKWPNVFTSNIKKIERKGKIFVDYLRNNRGATCVSAYSVRAKDSAPISMPIAWASLDSIKPNEVTIKNYKKYLNDSWKSFFKVDQKMK